MPTATPIRNGTRQPQLFTVARSSTLVTSALSADPGERRYRRQPQRNFRKTRDVQQLNVRQEISKRSYTLRLPKVLEAAASGPTTPRPSLRSADSWEVRRSERSGLPSARPMP